MKIQLLIKDPVEAQGLKWLLTSQWNDVHVEVAEDVDSSTDAYLFIVDMNTIMAEDFDLPSHAVWLGISSERTFQTVYQALSLKAEDILFRPFQPDRLVKQVQQIRFRWRNERTQQAPVQKQNSAVTYEDFLIGGTKADHPVLLSLIAPSRLDELDHLVRELELHDFPTTYDIFPFSDFVLVVHKLKELHVLQEAYSIFFAQWKRQSDALLTIYLHADVSENHTYRMLYKKMRKLHERIFYDGYDILTMEQEDLQWRDMDPFLSPLEQRQWVEMLEKRQVAEIRKWMEQDFLTFESPYPDPEMVRIRLSSILAQIRRYMTSKSLKTQPVEHSYHALFETVIREPVMYHIIQSFLSFMTELLEKIEGITAGKGSLVDKVQDRISANYWDPSWNLEACAEELKVHKTTLSRKFLKEVGEPFWKALQNMRIEEAKRLLTETDLPIAEVSDSAGFTHPSYFSRRFKEETGLSPYEFRMRWL